MIFQAISPFEIVLLLFVACKGLTMIRTIRRTMLEKKQRDRISRFPLSKPKHIPGMPKAWWLSSAFVVLDVTDENLATKLETPH